MTTFRRVFAAAFVASAAICSCHGGEIVLPLVSAYSLWSVAIMPGDDVTWVVQGRDTVKVIGSYGGQFKSGFLHNDAYSVEFPTPGLYPYFARSYSINHTSMSRDFGSHGIITVLDPTNNPPPLTINAPLEGTRFGRSRHPEDPTLSRTLPITILVTPRMPTNIVRIEVSTTLCGIGMDSEPPYQIEWTNAPPGKHTLVARAITHDNLQLSSWPVTISVEEIISPVIHSLRVLDNNLLAFDYFVPAFGATDYSSRVIITTRSNPLRCPAHS